jgi:hypothetical protein
LRALGGGSLLIGGGLATAGAIAGMYVLTTAVKDLDDWFHRGAIDAKNFAAAQDAVGTITKKVVDFGDVQEINTAKQALHDWIVERINSGESAGKASEDYYAEQEAVYKLSTQYAQARGNLNALSLQTKVSVDDLDGSRAPLASTLRRASTNSSRRCRNTSRSRSPAPRRHAPPPRSFRMKPTLRRTPT